MPRFRIVVFLPAFAALLVFPFLAGCDDPPDETTSAPNVILIVADDLGYGDLGSYGQEKIRTPHLDRMAREGLRFTNFYAGSTVCAPSRDALLTGRHTGHTFVRGNVGWPRGDAPLPDADVTIAEVLREAGYATGAFGKWSLGLAETSGAPHRQGFDAFFGYEDQTEAHYYYVDQLQAIREGATITIPVDSTIYSHDLIIDAAFSFIRRHSNRPFFAYVPVTIPHAELIVPPASLAEYLDEEGRSVFAPEPAFEGNGGYPPNPMPRATYAAMVSHLDRSVGSLLDLLDELGIAENTLILFTSDNGPHLEGGQEDTEFFNSNGPLRGQKRDLYDGGIRVPLLARWPARIAAGGVTNQAAAAWDLLPTFAEMAGATPPRAADGVSLLPLFDGRASLEERPYLYWEFARGGVFAQAARSGDWKAVRYFEGDAPPGLELYDLAADPGETTDLANEHPDVVELMASILDAAHRPAELEAFREREPAALASP